jgi:hypothetical protein
VTAGLLQGRLERNTFLRERKADAYGSAVEHLSRAAARRSELTVQGKPILTKEDQREWFLDLASGLHALTTAVAYASESWRRELRDILQRYGMAVSETTQGGLRPRNRLQGPYAGLEPFAEEEWSDDMTEILWQAVARVQEIAILDLSGYSSREAAVLEAQRAGR